MTAREAILRTPLAPVAVLTTAGIAIDRFCVVPWSIWVAVAALGLVTWFFVRRHNWLSILGLAVVLAAVGALHHHVRRNVFPVDDIGFLATDEPQLARLTGRLTDEPTFDAPAIGNPLRSIPESARTHAVLEVDALNGEPVTGRAALTLIGAKPALHAADVVEVTGWLSRPRGPDNPGERDYASALLDMRIRSTMLVRHVGDGVLRVKHGDYSLDWLLSEVRAWSHRQFDATLPPAEAATAAALLLGDGAALTRDDWQRYIRTGVVHVLAVSGQHLAILAAFAWFVLRGVGLRRRPGAAVVALGLCFYSLLVGGRAPVLRAAVMVCVACLGLFLRRPAKAGNGYALAWIIVVLLNPSDVADPGCQFSFLCVAVLIWGIGRWLDAKENDPLQEVLHAARPTWQRGLITIGRYVGTMYLVTTVLGLAIMPLTAARYHMVSLVGILIGPPAIVLASVALIAGFVQLLLALVSPALASVAAIGTRWSLSWLNGLVEMADGLPYGHFYTSEIDLWWLVGFYVLLAGAVLCRASVYRSFVLLIVWVIVGLVPSVFEAKPDGLRVTFLAVGHGGATLIEAPDGRVILVDIGSAAGPDVTRRVVAPYLWHRRIRRVDEVFLTHADLDHFNGLPQLLERFSVGRVNITPSFATKPTPGVRVTLAAIQDAGVPVRVIKTGDRFTAGEVEFEVLHPPANGPPGPENARSLVLVIRYHGFSLALTGDLDLEGRGQVLRLPRPAIDVLLAPHHGGRTANPPELSAWARPLVAVAHNGMGEAKQAGEMYKNAGVRLVGTWPNGAITLRVDGAGMWLETYHGTQRWLVRRRERLVQ